MDEEMYSHQKVGKWKLVDLSAGRKAIGNRWVFAIKLDNNNDILYLKKSNLREISADPCMYFNENLIVLFHVDDGLIMGPGETVHNYTKQLHEEFDMVVGEMDCYLGLQDQRLNDFMKINQTAYVKRVLAKYHMTDAKPISLAIEPGWIPHNSPPATDTDTYREIIGSLTYLTLGTLPRSSLCYTSTGTDTTHFQMTKAVKVTVHEKQKNLVSSPGPVESTVDHLSTIKKDTNQPHLCWFCSKTICQLFLKMHS
ncbi:uncharacterized protein LOC126456346 [Schistocerca serialis cubense]|uniref:uncharacterized protein LOC126456346 n=1 Tax=Schistocerca serialis cubense TaxID=2023355 RepID=UPI00214E34BF|nr:uncharacterized protein LOC126456346 [Schistocerca serialis cubense]